MKRMLVGLTGMVCLGFNCGAETITWNGPDGGSYTVDTNWNLGRLPGKDDQVVIDGANKAIFDAEGVESLFDRISVAGSLDIVNGTLRGSGLTSLGNGSSPGVITQTGGTAEFTAWGDNTFNLSGPLATPSRYLLSGGLLNGTGDGNFQIGYHGAGEIVQTGGKLRAGAFFVLGRYPGDVGTYTFSNGVFEQYRGGRNMLIGEEGSGSATFCGTAQANLVGLQIGNGSFTLSDNAVLQTGYIRYDPRYNGNASMAIDGGTIVTRGKDQYNDAFFSGNIATTLGENGATFDIEGSMTVSVSLGGVSNDGGLTKKGSGVLSLTGANTYTGPTAVDEGILVINDVAALTHSQSITVAADAGLGIWATALTSATADALLASIHFDPGTFLAIDTTPGSIELETAIPFPAGTSLAKTGPNALTLKTPQTHTGETRIYYGILDAGCDNALPNASCISMLGGSFAPYGNTYSVLFGTDAGKIKLNDGYPFGLAACGENLTATFGDSDEPYTVGGSAFPVSILLLNDIGANSPLTIANPLVLDRAVTITVNSDQPVTLAGTVTATGSDTTANAQALTKSGGGTLNLPAGVTFADKRNSLFVNGGTVDLDSTITASELTLNYGSQVILDDPAFNGTIDHLLVGKYGTTSVLRMSAGTIDADYQFGLGDLDGTGGTLQMSGGTITSSRLRIGRFSGATVIQSGGLIHRNRGGDEVYIAGDNKDHKGVGASYTISGDGELKVAGNFQVGRYGNGTMNQLGGTVECTSWMAIARYKESVGSYTMTGGRLNVTGGGQGLVLGEEGTATMTVSDDAVVNIAGALYFSGGSGWTGTGNGTLNLKDGGTLITKQITRNDTTSLMSLNIDGGIIRIPGENAIYGDFLHGITGMTIGEKGLTLDTGSNTVVINQPISEATSSGKIIKQGSGTLVLGNDNNILGGTVIEEGTLVLGPSYAVASGMVSTEPTVPGLAHRWSFNRSLEDSAGDSDAQFIGSTTVAYTEAGNAVALPGGANGTGAINLGSQLFPTDGTPVTVEIWATQREIKNWARLFDFGNGQDNYILLSWTCGTDINQDDEEIKYNNTAWASRNRLAPFTLGKEFHISAVFIPNVFGDGRMMVRWAKRETNGRLMKSGVSITPAPYSFADLQQNSFFLGRSRYGGDNDAAADYNEVRFWNMALSDEQLTQNVLLGPDTLPDLKNVNPNILPTDADEALVKNNYLTHRWSFNGDTADSIGGPDATANGAYSYTDGKMIRLEGNGRGSAWIDLGPNIVPAAATPVTIEIWGTQHAVRNWSRILDIANPDDHTNDSILFCWTQGTDINKDGVCIKAVHKNDLTLSGLAPFTLNQEFHICYVFIPDAEGRNTTVHCYKQDAVTGDTLAHFSFIAENWTWAQQSQRDCFLGRSHYNDSDPCASYNEVRIWNAALTQSQLTLNAVAGPDTILPITQTESTYSLSPLTVAQDATFDLGARSLTLETVEGEGTLAGTGKLTVSKTLDPAGSDVGTLTVNVPTTLTGEWIVDIGNGTDDLITGIGSIDISQGTLTIRNPEQLKGGTHLIAALPPHAIIGSFKTTNIAGTGFVINYSAEEGLLKLVPSGMVILVH
ncbi:MAG: autotransporter-associated beta strand repeat-containing protein [Kiritimatiellae bacterium]|nr:autotransporter-associated beta strand repeat-containing protein [Kiritimatiellia bacterium]